MVKSTVRLIDVHVKNVKNLVNVWYLLVWEFYLSNAQSDKSGYGLFRMLVKLSKIFFTFFPWFLVCYTLVDYPSKLDCSVGSTKTFLEEFFMKCYYDINSFLRRIVLQRYQKKKMKLCSYHNL